MANDISGKAVSKRKAREAGEHHESPKAPEAVALRSEARIRRTTLATEIAESDIFSRNFRFRDAEVHFPLKPLMRTVDKFYPYAKGGALLVDEPKDKAEEKVCLEKAKVLKELGYRYLILKQDSDEFEARQNLGEI